MKNLINYFFLVLLSLLFLYNCNSENNRKCEVSGTGMLSSAPTRLSAASATSATPTTSSSNDLEIKKDMTRLLLNPGKIYLYDKYLYINDSSWGIHIYNNSDPSNPIKFTSIQIYGNHDIAVKDGIIFADSYMGLLAIKINEKGEPEVKAKLQEIIAGYGYNDNMPMVSNSIPDNFFLVRSYKDCGNKKFDIFPIFNTINYSYATATGTSTTTSSSGTGGSMARFTISGDYLYVLSYSQLFTIKILDAQNPSFIKASYLNSSMETVFLFKNYLMLGSETGMFIYDITTPENPVYYSNFGHTRSCDPVVAQGNYAYITLRTGCGSNAVNELDILDISNIKNPLLVKSYPMTSPYGLGIDGNYLFICDKKEGLAIYNVQDPSNISLLNKIKDMEPYDIILNAKKATLTGNLGVYQYNYADINNISILSKIYKQ